MQQNSYFYNVNHVVRCRFSTVKHSSGMRMFDDCLTVKNLSGNNTDHWVLTEIPAESLTFRIITNPSHNGLSVGMCLPEASLSNPSDFIAKSWRLSTYHRLLLERSRVSHERARVVIPEGAVVRVEKCGSVGNVLIFSVYTVNFGGPNSTRYFNALFEKAMRAPGSDFTPGDVQESLNCGLTPEEYLELSSRVKKEVIGPVSTGLSDTEFESLVGCVCMSYSGDSVQILC